VELHSGKDKLPVWRWWVYLAVFALFPVVFHPWWLAIICMAVFCGLVVLVLYVKPDSK
jgi:hypothetical protein